MCQLDPTRDGISVNGGAPVTRDIKASSEHLTKPDNITAMPTTPAAQKVQKVVSLNDNVTFQLYSILK